jgi:amidase
MGMLPDFDPLVVSAFELSELLNAQAISCVEIVELYLHQIEQHNRRGRQLRALISVAPKHELLKIAKKLDDERLRGKIRGPLHGIPIVLKDNIMTDEQLGMDTTVGKPSIRRAILFKANVTKAHMLLSDARRRRMRQLLTA